VPIDVCGRQLGARPWFREEEHTIVSVDLAISDYAGLDSGFAASKTTCAAWVTVLTRWWWFRVGLGSEVGGLLLCCLSSHQAAHSCVLLELPRSVYVSAVSFLWLVLSWRGRAT
jgi:hypothetical protein